MSTHTAPLLGARIEPDRLYSYAQAGAVIGLSARKIKREVEEYGRMGHVLTGHERGKMIRGSQLLAWLDAQEVPPRDTER